MSSYANHVLFSSKVWIGHKLNDVSNTIVNVESNTWTDERIEQEWHRSLMLKFFQPSHNCRGTMKMGHSRLLLFFSAALIHLVIPTAAQYCYDTGNYTSNSTYRANLNTLLASMINNTKKNYGFYNFSFGEAPDKVYAIALCRGDASPSECRGCISGASSDLLKALSKPKGGNHLA